MTTKRSRGVGRRSCAWVVAALIMGACATGAQAQVQFSAWPICNDGSMPLSSQSWIWNDGGGAQGIGTFQPIPPKPSDWEIGTIALALVVTDLAGQDLPLSAVSSAHVIGYLGQPPGLNESPGTPAFSIPVSLSPQMFADTGGTVPSGGTIWRLVVPIPTQVVPANETLSIGFVVETDPSLAIGGVFESDLIDPAVLPAWAYSFPDDQNIAVGFGPGFCDDIMAIELYGPVSVPTVSTWGAIAMTLLMLTAGTIVYRYRMSSIQAA